jgi:hypothetical protein
MVHNGSPFHRDANVTNNAESVGRRSAEGQKTGVLSGGHDHRPSTGWPFLTRRVVLDAHSKMMEWYEERRHAPLVDPQVCALISFEQYTGEG